MFVTYRSSVSLPALNRFGFKVKDVMMIFLDWTEPFEDWAQNKVYDLRSAAALRVGSALRRKPYEQLIVV